jgi:hypothetical protein
MYEKWKVLFRKKEVKRNFSHNDYFADLSLSKSLLRKHFVVIVEATQELVARVYVHGNSRRMV